MNPGRPFIFVRLAELKENTQQDVLLLDVPPDLSDLGWLREQQIFLFHSRLPLAGSQHDQHAYLRVLADVARNAQSGRKVSVAFDPGLEREAAFARSNS